MWLSPANQRMSSTQVKINHTGGRVQEVFFFFALKMKRLVLEYRQPYIFELYLEASNHVYC